jgi:acetyl esterase/lipase
VLSKFPPSTLAAAQVPHLHAPPRCFMCNMVGQLDPLLDDSTLMSRRLHELGVPVRYSCCI